MIEASGGVHRGPIVPEDQIALIVLPDHREPVLRRVLQEPALAPPLRHARVLHAIDRLCGREHLLAESLASRQHGAGPLVETVCTPKQSV